MLNVDDVGEAVEELEELYLDETEIGDEGMNIVRKLPALRALGLVGTRVTDMGIRQLAGLVKLERLDLGSTDVSDAGIALHRRALGCTQATGSRQRAVDPAAGRALTMPCALH